MDLRQRRHETGQNGGVSTLAAATVQGRGEPGVLSGCRLWISMNTVNGRQGNGINRA